jgi:hypothetical protein
MPSTYAATRIGFYRCDELRLPRATASERVAQIDGSCFYADFPPYTSARGMLSIYQSRLATIILEQGGAKDGG